MGRKTKDLTGSKIGRLTVLKEEKLYEKRVFFPGDNAMSKEEFINLAVSCGYGTKAAAENYVNKHDKPEYTTSDFIELYHTSMHWYGVASDKGLLPAHGVNGRTTAFRNGVGGNSGSSQDWR